MGCVSGKNCEDDELPVHQVTFSKPFYMGKYEVTFLQYDRYVWEQQNNGNEQITYPSDQGWGRYDRPVVEVSWHDAQSYIQWLNKKTGKNYRLPSEAQWEYAARAGTDTHFATGDCITGKQANFQDNYQWDGEEGCKPTGEYLGKSSIVGSYPANAFQLHDMHGNALEWVEDGYHADYEQAPVDGSPWKTSQDEGRILRGGSWFSLRQFMRSASRYGELPDNREYRIGFRLTQVKH